MILVSDVMGVGINENNVNSFAIYPNPASSTLNIDLYGNSVEELNILNITGQKVITKFNLANFIEIPVNHLESGFYMIQLITDSGIVEQKLVIE